MMKEKTTAKETAAAKQIRELDTKALMKMDVGKFCLLREKANAEELRRLDYLLDQADLEYKIRKIVREEIAKARSGREAK